MICRPLKLTRPAPAGRHGNLIINGAEAISPEGGTVWFKRATGNIDEQYIATLSMPGQHLRPGSHVLLQVHFMGCGMDEDNYC